MTDRLDPGEHTALPKALLELLIARHRLGETWWTIETDRQTTAALGRLVRDGWIELTSTPQPRCTRARIRPAVWERYTRDVRYTAPA